MSIDTSLPHLGDIHIGGQNELLIEKIYLGNDSSNTHIFTTKHKVQNKDHLAFFARGVAMHHLKPYSFGASLHFMVHDLLWVK